MEQIQQSLMPFRAQQAPSRLGRYLAAHGGVEGWFLPEAAATWDALLERQRAEGVGGHILEIGVWHGKSAAMLGLHAEFGSELLILVDECVGPDVCQASLGDAGVPWGEGIHHLQVPSEELAALPLMQGGFQAFRWIHVSGERTFGAVMGDLAIADRFLAKNGVVCVDDFFNRRYPQVREAVQRYVQEHSEQFSLFLCGFNKAYLARPHDVHGLQEYCAGSLVDDLESRGVETMITKTSDPSGMNCLGLGPRVDGRRTMGTESEPPEIRA